jgi:hypothetical protein
MLIAGLGLIAADIGISSDVVKKVSKLTPIKI